MILLAKWSANFAMDNKRGKLRMKEATHELEVKKCLLKNM